MSGEVYELVLGSAARRASTERLPEAVAAAVVTFMTSALVQEPHRARKTLRGELTGIWSARHGTYRSSIASPTSDIKSSASQHRRDVYRGG